MRLTLTLADGVVGEPQQRLGELVDPLNPHATDLPVHEPVAVDPLDLVQGRRRLSRAVVRIPQFALQSVG